jgi:hypothetical protein
MGIGYSSEQNRFTDREQPGLEDIIYVYSRHLATNKKKIVTG